MPLIDGRKQRVYGEEESIGYELTDTRPFFRVIISLLEISHRLAMVSGGSSILLAIGGNERPQIATAGPF